MLGWIGEQAEGAWNWVSGAASGLWHDVVKFVHHMVHAVVGWLQGLFGVIGWAWSHLLEGAYALWSGIEFLAGEAANFLVTFVTHTLPSIWHKIEHAAKQAWLWVENALKWAAKHIAHLAVKAWHWVQGALKWVNHHVLRPLEHLASYVWHHLTKWAHFAFYLLTHPLKLAEIIFWPLWYFFEQVAWKVARRIGKWLAELVLHNLVRLVHVVEDIVAGVL